MNTIIPSIANDNIYKFITVLGLVLFLSPSILREKQLNNKLEYIECKNENRNN